MAKNYFIFLGPPGSGKGTQADILAEKIKLPVISPGELLRHEIEENTEVGRKVKPIMDEGELVPDKIVEEIIDNMLKRDDAKSGIIFDGYPRREEQLEHLVKRLEKIMDGDDRVCAILVDVGDEEVEQRLSGRRACDCGIVYHLKYSPPKKEGICDSCGDDLYIRTDDKPDVMEERLELYHKETQPLIDYWQARGELVIVDGKQDIKVVQKEIVRKLSQKKLIKVFKYCKMNMPMLKLPDKVILLNLFFVITLSVLVWFFIGDSLELILVIATAFYAVIFVVNYIITIKHSKRITELTRVIEKANQDEILDYFKKENGGEIGKLTKVLNDLIVEEDKSENIEDNEEIDKAKTDFVALASHQLRTPLSIIKWYVDFLLDGDAGALTKEQKKYLKEVYNSNERLIELVNALLDVSRIDVGTFSIEPEPTDIVERAESALKRHLPDIKAKKIKLEKDYDDLPLLDLDPRLTKILFENLISNSVKYTPENGIIRIVIERQARNILIKISDSGCGIPKNQQPKIFTKLFRADNVRRIENIGTGLGLYIVKAVVENSGGKIWFESPSKDLLKASVKKTVDLKTGSVNQGTTFFISIPLKGMKKREGTKKLSSVN